MTRVNGWGSDRTRLLIFFLSPGAHLDISDLTAKSKRGTQTLLVRVEAEVADHDPIARL